MTEQILKLSDYLNGDGKTDNTTQFNALLLKCKQFNQTIINVDAGIYRMHVIYMQSNITFNFADGAVFQGLSTGQSFIVYQSPGLGYSGGVKNVCWENAHFKGTIPNGNSDDGTFTHAMQHAQNIRFDHCYFERAHGRQCHQIDLGGCSQIYINGCIFEGYGGTESMPDKSSYQEAIQIDNSYAGGSSYGNSVDQYDDLGTKSVYVTNCTFKPAYDDAGEVIAWGPNPIGQHVQKDDIISDIYFIGNTVIDPVGFSWSETAPIHFPAIAGLVIADNKFIIDKAPQPYSMIRLNCYRGNGQQVISNVLINGNYFINCHPSQGLVYAIAAQDAATDNGGYRNIMVTGNQTDGKTEFLTKINPAAMINVSDSDNSTDLNNSYAALTLPDGFGLEGVKVVVNGNVLRLYCALNQLNEQAGLAQFDQVKIKIDYPQLIISDQFNRGFYLQLMQTINVESLWLQKMARQLNDWPVYAQLIFKLNNIIDLLLNSAINVINQNAVTISTYLNQIFNVLFNDALISSRYLRE